MSPCVQTSTGMAVVLKHAHLWGPWPLHELWIEDLLPAMQTLHIGPILKVVSCIKGSQQGLSKITAVLSGADDTNWFLDNINNLRALSKRLLAKFPR